MRSIVIPNTRRGIRQSALVTPTRHTPRMPITHVRRAPYGGVEVRTLGGAR